MSADQFATWQQLLKLAETNKTRAALREAITAAGIQIHESEPFSGYFRCAAVKDGPMLPVAIWREGGTLRIFRNGEPVKLERVWPYSVWNPISYDWYEEYTEKSGKWPDAAAEPTATSAAEKHADQVVAAAEPAPVGTAIEVRADQPVEDEEAKLTKKLEAEAFKKKIADALAVAKTAHLNIQSDEEAAAAQSARSDFNKLKNDADKKRKALMEPFTSKADAIHAVWQPVVKEAEAAGKTVLDAINQWLNVTKPAQLAAAAAAKSSDTETKQETETLVPTVDGAVPTTHNEPPQPSEPASPPAAVPTATVIKGATGRAARINQVTTATVTDYDALYQHVKAFPEVKTVLDRIAQRLVDAGDKDIPGVSTGTMQKAS